MPWIQYLLTGLFLAPCIIQWRLTVRLYGELPLRFVLPNVRQILRTKKAFLLIAAALAPFEVLGGACLPEWFPPLPPWFATLGILVASYLATPPAVLLLASSRKANIGMIFDADMATAPMSLVHLIEPDSESLAASDIDFVRFNSRRTVKDDRWRDAVDVYMDMVPIIVIDTRIASPAIVHETKNLLASERRRKTLFIVGENKEQPALEAAAGEDARLLSFVKISVDDLGTILRKLSRTKNLAL